MKTKSFLSTLLATSLIFIPAERALADKGDFLGGVAVGIIGSAIVNNERRKAQQRQAAPRQTVRRRAAPVNTYARQQNREMQTALNYFGFPAGTPDGIVGRNTRNAVSQYQAHMGYPVTGQMTEYERNFLVTSYQRAIAGGAYTQQQIAQHGGPRGLLIAYRNEAAGVATPQTATPVAPSQAGTVVVVPQTVVTPEASAPVTASADVPPVEAPEAAGSALPSFGVVDASASMASHCNQVNLVTSSNGGFMTVADMRDPNFALSEQFCIARTYAIAEGEALSAQVQGVTLAQMDAQCEGLVPAMTQQIAGLSIKGRDDVVEEVSDFALSTGQSPAQLTSTAKICLSSGYRTDNADVAISSALILVALGQPVYSELLGHHLTRGFGASTRPDLARAWYTDAIDALDNGATAVVAPGQTDRVDLLRAATGGGQAASAGNAVVVPAFQVPSNN